MRIVVDGNLSESTTTFSESTATFLNNSGHDAVWVGSLMPSQSPDSDIVVKAIAESRVIVTRDLGFSKIILASGRTEPSLITIRLADSSVDANNQALAEHPSSLEEAVLAGVLVTIDEKGPRVHPLRTDGSAPTLT